MAPQPEGLVLDREAASKGLLEWLRQNPNYTMELSPFSPVGMSGEAPLQGRGCSARLPVPFHSSVPL